MDGLLDRHAETGVGCHMGIRFIGALALATLFGLKVLVDACEKYAEEYNISFNGSKSRLLLFKGRQSKVSNRSIIVNGVLLNMSESTVHLGHHVCINDKDHIVTAAKAIFWRSFNLFMSDYGHIYSFLKGQLFVNTVVAIMVHCYGHSVVVGWIQYV